MQGNLIFEIYHEEKILILDLDLGVGVGAMLVSSRYPVSFASFSRSSRRINLEIQKHSVLIFFSFKYIVLFQLMLLLVFINAHLLLLETFFISALIEIFKLI
jgi:hypothetical protein